MSALTRLEQCETIAELIDLINQQIPTARVLFIESEIVIKTGLEVSMGGYLHKIGEDDE